jgi:hypothetical protein
MDSFLKSRAAQLFEMRNVSQENPRNEVPRAFLEMAIERFQDHVHKSYAELVLNLDEMRISE